MPNFKILNYNAIHFLENLALFLMLKLILLKNA